MSAALLDGPIYVATAQTIAEALGITKRAVIMRAVEESWVAHTESVRGGKGNRYHVMALPPPVRDVVVAHLAGIGPAPKLALVPAIAEPAAPEQLSQTQRRCEAARHAVLAEIDRLAALAGTYQRAIEAFQTAYEEGRLSPALAALVPAANARGSETRAISRGSIFAWRKARDEGQSLAPRDTRTAPPVPAWAGILLRLYRVPSKPALAAVMAELPKHLEPGVPCPTYGQARRFLDRLSIVERERGRLGPNALLRHRGFKRRSTDGLLPMEVTTADGHTFKADVAHPRHGRPFRPEVCAVLDVATRRVVGWSAGLAESTHVVQDSIRVTVERHGQFSLFYTDNGAGFTGHAMTDELVGLLGRVGATPITALPGRAQARGKIERLQGTLWKAASRTLPSYNGRDMDPQARRKVVKLVKQDLAARGAARALMPWDGFLEWIGAQVAKYNARPHAALPRIRDEATGKLRHQSPDETWAQFTAEGWSPDLLPKAVTDELFRPQEVRWTTRGEVQLPFGRYYHDDLVGWGKTQVRVGYDIHDGSKVWVRTLEDQRLICIALRDGNVIPEQPASKIEEANLRRAQGRKKLLESHLEEVAAELGPKLVELEDFSAGRSPPSATPTALGRFADPAIIELHPRQAQAEIDAAARESRIARWREIEARLKAGDAVEPDDARWHRVYGASSELRTQQLLDRATESA
jgi:putative transposase